MTATQKLNTGRSSQFTDSEKSQIVEDPGPFAITGVMTQITGMSITPAAGTYMVWYAGTYNQFNGGNVLTLEIFAGGVGVAGSVKNVDIHIVGVSSIAHVGTLARVTVNGAQAIEARAAATGVNNTMTDSQLMISLTA